MSAGDARRLVILHQFDPGGGVAPFVLAHLRGLRSIASRLVLVSNSPIDAKGRSAAETICDLVVERSNRGWDFAGWRDVIRNEAMADFDAVILTNSSVVGPLYPLALIVNRMEAGNSDFWGLVLSRHKRPHLQSYFLAFNRQVLLSDCWRRFWGGVEDLEDKRKVIRKYETGITAALTDAGFRPAALMPNPRVPQSIRIVDIERLKGRLRIPFDVNRVNRTVELHDELIEQGFPYLKASLLWGKDVHRLRNFKRIRAMTQGNFDWSVVESDMRG